MLSLSPPLTLIGLIAVSSMTMTACALQAPVLESSPAAPAAEGEVRARSLSAPLAALPLSGAPAPGVHAAEAPQLCLIGEQKFQPELCEGLPVPAYGEQLAASTYGAAPVAHRLGTSAPRG